jgi:hypothetical protein
MVDSLEEALLQYVCCNIRILNRSTLRLLEEPVL